MNASLDGPVTSIRGTARLPSQKKLRWMLNRLAAMSPAEILHRFAERWRQEQGRRLDGWDAMATQWGRFVPLAIDDTELARLACSCGGDWKAIASDFAEGSWTFLGRQWPGRSFAQSIHLDPVSGQAWEADAYCFDIDFRHRSGMGDIKYVWELNRLQFLVPMAAMARNDKDAALAQACFEAIFIWADANPPFRGVNWNSGIELALRAISIIAVISLLGVDELSAAERGRLSAILNAHAIWLDRYPSRYSSANNHLVAEATGLYVIGSLMPDLPNARRYRHYGQHTLEAEATRQFHSDGVGAEQSPTYTAFTLELYCTALAAARARGDAWAAVVTEQLRLAATFLGWITDGNGNQPRFGDDDEGRVFISLPGQEKSYVASVMNAVAAATGDREVAAPLPVPNLRDLFFGHAAPSTMERTGLKSFDVGGYSVFRDSIAGHRAMLVFDHGPLGYLSIAAHGHADALAVWLHVDGRPVLVDAGTYLYHSGRDARDRFRGTSMHNTLEVNGLDQSIIVGAFNWSHKARAWRSDSHGAQMVVGRHDGYEGRAGVVHERRIARTNGGYEIADRLVGPADRIATTVLRYFLAPDIEASMIQSGHVHLLREGTLLLEIAMADSSGQGLDLEVVAVETSPSFGVKEKSLALVAKVPVSVWRNGAVTTRLHFAATADR